MQYMMLTLSFIISPIKKGNYEQANKRNKVKQKNGYNAFYMNH